MIEKRKSGLKTNLWSILDKGCYKSTNTKSVVSRPHEGNASLSQKSFQDG